MKQALRDESPTYLFIALKALFGIVAIFSVGAAVSLWNIAIMDSTSIGVGDVELSLSQAVVVAVALLLAGSFAQAGSHSVRQVEEFSTVRRALVHHLPLLLMLLIGTAVFGVLIYFIDRYYNLGLDVIIVLAVGVIFRYSVSFSKAVQGSLT